MSNHTPGPWKVTKADKVLSIDSESSTGIRGDPCGESVGTAYRMPDATLIAAAPDMLEALREAERAFRNCPGNWPQQTHDLVCAAIAKAEGKP